MKGIVLLVNKDENSAILADYSKVKYTFSLDDCIGFETYPSVGEKVQFGLDNDNQVYFVEYIKVLEKEAIFEEKTTKDELISELNNKSNIQLELNIPITKSISDCLDNYFNDIVAAVEEYEAEFAEGETLNFLLMQRFLNTAYNNLKDIDSTFSDEYLAELRSDLIALEKLYKKFSRKNIVAEIAYEEIFLDQQVVYQNNKKRMLSNNSELITSKTTIKSLEHHIESLEKQINNSKLNENLLESKIIDLKKYKKYYVDILHRSANLKEENLLLREALEKFSNKHMEEFIVAYQKEAVAYNDFIIEQLDGYSYEYDKVMWERAEKSSAIRSFFKKSNIEDDYSSRTFLKYFIKSLDSEKYSKENEKLSNMLEYLESIAKARILIVGEEFSKSEHIKHLVRSFDKDYSVEKTDKPRSTYFRNDLEKLDIIFIDFRIKSPTIFEFIDMLQKRLEQTKGKAILCVTSNSFTKISIIQLKQKNIDYLLDTRLNDTELLLHVEKIMAKIDE